MKNNSKISGKKAVPGGVKKDASFTKRSAATQKQDAGRKGPREDFGPRTSGNIGSNVSDGAGTRSQAGLPPSTIAMSAPTAELPAVATELAAATLPVPDCNTPLFSVEPWDMKRDLKMGKAGSR